MSTSMTTIREGLENPENLSNKERSIAIAYGLLNFDGTVSELGSKLLQKDSEAYEIVKSRIEKFWLVERCEPDWVTKLVHKKYPRVFGYGYK